MVSSLNQEDIRFYIILIIIDICLFFTYLIYVYFDERKKWKKREFFKYTLHYEIEYSLYFDMVKKMKRIIFIKKIELLFLTILVMFRRLVVWKK